MFTKLIRKLFCLIMLLTFLCAPVMAITTDEYRALMSNPDFAHADRRINELWDKVQSVAPQSVLDFLHQAQTEWWEYDLDSKAAYLMKEDKYSREAAYTKATEQCADELQILLKGLTTPVKPNKLIGEYVRIWEKEETGWLTVKWSNKKKSEVKLELSAIGGGTKEYGSDYYAPHTGEWEGQAVIKNRVLAFSQDNSFYEAEDGYIIIVFQDDNTVLIQTLGSIGDTGAAVTFNGEYKREK